MGIIGAMFKAGYKEVKKSVNRRVKRALRKASGKPIRVGGTAKRPATRGKTTRGKVRKLPKMKGA